jgi:hypothetical protein
LFFVEGFDSKEPSAAAFILGEGNEGIQMTSSAHYQGQASTLIRLAQMRADPSRAAALLLLANERLVLANQREPQTTEQHVPVLLRNKPVCQR